MTAPRRRVALVAPADLMRTALTNYLTNAGFEVHECEELAVPSGFAALVAISPSGISDALLAQLRSWVKLAKPQRLVVVTSKPSALKDLVAAHGERLRVLPAPAFGWELVDALRAMEGPGPRGA